jgi:hypothetical protein
MTELAEVLATVIGSVLAILAICTIGWFLVVVIAPLGWAIAILFTGLLLVLIGLINIIRVDPPL